MAGLASLYVGDSEYDLVADVVNIETRRGGMSVNLHTVLNVTIVLGVFTAIVALLGIAGILQQNGSVVSCYGQTYFVLFIVFSFMALASAQLHTTMLPVVEDQTALFCNATLMPSLSSELGCQDALPQTVPECGLECQDQAAHLSEYGGCDLLTDLCHDMIYVDVGVGNCMIAVDSNGSYARPRTWILADVTTGSAEECQIKCSDTIDCVGFTYSTTHQICMYILPMGPTSDENWTMLDGAPVPDEWTSMVSDGTAENECQVKDHPNLADEAQDIFFLADALFSAIVGALIMASLFGCALQYTEATGRQGKKGLMPLASKLCCPCGRQRHRRFTDDNDEESELNG